MSLQAVLAEMTLKDLASPNLEKIRKAVLADVEAMKKGEKQANVFQKSLGKIKGFTAGIGKTMAGANAGAQNITAGVAGGSGFNQAVSQIHIVGPYLAAALTAMEGSAQNYVAGVRLQQVQTKAQTNFSMMFKKNVVQSTKLMTDTMFHLRDKQQALTALADQGVKEETIGKSADVIGAFTKSQGLSTLEEGVNALMSGNVKAGRGLNSVQIKLIQAYAPLLRDTMTADIGMRGIARVLNKSEKQINTAGDEFEKGAGGMQKATVAIQSMEEATTVLGTGSAEAFESAHTVKQMNNTLMNTLGGLAGTAVGKIEDLVVSRLGKGGGAKGSKKMKKRARGGEVSPSEEFLVGEEGPEVFRPNTSGRIVPMSSAGSRGEVKIVNNFHINGGDPQTVKRMVLDAMNTAARTIWRQNTGLPAMG